MDLVEPFTKHFALIGFFQIEFTNESRHVLDGVAWFPFSTDSMDVVPGDTAPGRNQMNTEMFGPREEVWILRAHIAELKILVKHSHAREGHISHGILVEHRGIPTFRLARFYFDFEILQIMA